MSQKPDTSHIYACIETYNTTNILEFESNLIKRAQSIFYKFDFEYL